MAADIGDGQRRPDDGTDASDGHRVLAVADDGAVALAFEIAVHRRGRDRWGSFHCAVFRAGLDPVVIAENDMPVPDDRWEFRTSGLWVEAVCETPLVHWSYGLEAFGLAIDEPEELLGRGYGDRVPVGWELEFEGTAADFRDDRQAGRVHGILLFGDGEQPFAGVARRRRWVGPPEPTDDTPMALTGPAATEPAAGAVHGPVEVALPTRDGVWWVARTEVGLDCRLSAPAGPR
ncbi:MAG: hypothetical protein AAF547_14705 [Actinomycetota bacterium]